MSSRSGITVGFSQTQFNVRTPFSMPMNGFRRPQHIRIVGVCKAIPCRHNDFSVIFRSSYNEHLFSFKQQFDTFSVALSSSRHGPWKDESNGCDYPWDDIPSPFHVDKVFTLDFVAREDDIVVNHNGHHFYTFKTGSCCGEIRSMEISGNIEVHAVHALSR
ncbi:hypothetical protein QR680_018640 [Steinernema hermaphroditum]|uniref:Galectin n=1 Tax=Steinernema hermaphroditum TaxID=289476 RepID=A0AA39HIL9_9BILA|nr:hypothetical protein QR680_018640 [Steinernema hermaphroditum]